MHKQVIISCKQYKRET